MEADIEEDDVGRPVGNVQDAREGFISLDKRLTRFVGKCQPSFASKFNYPKRATCW